MVIPIPIVDDGYVVVTHTNTMIEEILKIDKHKKNVDE